MGVAPEPAVKGRELLVHHGVPADRVDELVEFLLVWQLAVEEQVGDFHEARFFGELINRIAAVEQNAFLTVNVRDGAFAARRRGEAGVVGE